MRDSQQAGKGREKMKREFCTSGKRTKRILVGEDWEEIVEAVEILDFRQSLQMEGPCWLGFLALALLLLGEAV